MNEVDEQQLPSTTTMHLAYAEASVMVLECLMRLLIDRKLVSLDDVMDVVELASDTKRTLAQDGVHPEISRVALGVLSSLANSLAAGGAPPPPPSTKRPDPTAA